MYVVDFIVRLKNCVVLLPCSRSELCESEERFILFHISLDLEMLNY